jgi:hypothetical protein
VRQRRQREVHPSAGRPAARPTTRSGDSQHKEEKDMRSSRVLTAVRLILAVAGAALIGGLELAAPAAAHVSVQPAAASAYALTAGRLWSMVAMLLGLTGVAIGGLALARPAGRFGTGSGSGRLGTTVAVAAGLIAMALGGVVVAAADGGPGTGGGIVGGFVALVVGLIAIVLGGLAMARTRRTG